MDTIVNAIATVSTDIGKVLAVPIVKKAGSSQAVLSVTMIMELTVVVYVVKLDKAGWFRREIKLTCSFIVGIAMKSKK